MFYPASCEPYCDADERTPSDDAVQSVAEFQVASGMAWHCVDSECNRHSFNP